MMGMMSDGHKKPLISVIMPVYNGQDTLRKSAESVLGQTFRDFELILVDDGSTDGSPAIADDIAASDPDRVRVIHRENGGLVRAWLDGVEAAGGECLSFVDSDDTIDAGMLEDMASKLLRTDDGSGIVPGQIVACGYLIEYEKKAPKAMGHGLPEGVYEGGRLQRELKENILGHERRRVIFSRCMKLISRELITGNAHYLDFSIRRAEDMSIMVAALLDAGRVVIMQKPYYHYVFMQGSMVHCYDDRIHKDYGKLRKILYRVVSDKLGERFVSMVDREYLFLFMQILQNELRRTDGPGASKKAVESVIRLCETENSRKLLAECEEPLTEKANRLLAVICRKPSPVRILMVRAVFLAYELIRR